MIRTRALLLALLFAPLLAAGSAPSSSAQPATGDLVITEIHFAPSPSSNEFVELLNVSDATVDLQTVSYADGNLDADPVATAPALLAPGERAVIVRDPAAFEAAFPGVPYLAPDDWEALNNGGDLVLLLAGTTVVDAVEYDGSWATVDDASLERIDPLAPAEAFNFTSSTAPAGATPGAQNSVYAPDREAPRPVFAEVLAPQVVEVVFSEALHPASLDGALVQLGDGGSPAEVTALTLVEPSVLRIEHTRPDAPATVTVASVADRTGNRLPGATLPVAQRPMRGDVALNELLPAPRADDFDDRPNQPEYVEILNLTAAPLSLRGLALTDRPREDGTADTLAVGRRVALPPRGYGVVFAARDVLSTPTEDGTLPDPATASLLARAFPDAPLRDPSVALLPVDAASLGLRNGGDVVRLHRADGLLLDSVAYDPDWHAEALDDPTGTSLERVSPTAPPSAPDNWRSSASPWGGTPGAPNVAALSAAPTAASAGVTVTPSPFSADRDGGTRIRYALRAEASVVRVRIFDAVGRRVRTLTDARLSGREGEMVWNGRGDDGRQLRVGIYVVLVDAVDAEGGTVEQHKRPVVLARPLR